MKLFLHRYVAVDRAWVGPRYFLNDGEKMMKMKSHFLKIIFGCGVLAFMVTSGFAAEGDLIKRPSLSTQKLKGVVLKGGVVVCAQENINGFAGKRYDTKKACAADMKKGTLNTLAVQDGITKCKNFCKSLQCNPPDFTKSKPTASTVCKNPANDGRRTYGRAKTNRPIICKCTE